MRGEVLHGPERHGDAWQVNARQGFFSIRKGLTMLQRFIFEITGLTPILMNNPGGMKKPGDDAGAKVRKLPTPDEEAKGLLYLDEKGRIFGPANGFKSCIVRAATGKKFGKVSAPMVIKGNVFCPVDTERTLLYHPKTKKLLTANDYTVDSRRAVLMKTRGIVRSRPRFEHWGCDVVLEIETDFVQPSVVEDLLQVGGRTVGFLDFRPERGGSFGRFEAKLKK
jgi:hypothetical protein